MYNQFNIKKMRTIVLLTFALTIALSFASCEDDETASKPVVTLIELGEENSKTGYAGSDLHIEAEIVAEGKIDKVNIEIHPEGEHEEKGVAWEVDTTYTEFSGLKNTIFHKHIDIPANAEPGHYHFHFTVTDMEGQQAAVEEEFEIIEEI